MIDELNKHYDEFKEVFNILPTNTKNNIKKKLIYLEEEENNNNKNIELVKNEILTRINKFNNLKVNNNIDKYNEELEKCNIVNEWNNYNTSYEKMHLDYYLYQLHRYYKEDLEGVNNCIKNILESFKKVDINITVEDFDFNDLACEYMSQIINNKSFDELKKTFEEIYWKNSEIIKIIEINFKSIYLKYERKIDKYYENRHNEFLKNHTDKEIYDIRIKLNNDLEELKECDSYLNFQKFVNNEYLLSDYKELEIEKKKNLYFENNYNIIRLKELYYTLEEYKILIKYKYLFDDMKSKLQDKANFKNSKSNLLKEISKKEKELKKLNISHNKKNLFGKKNDEKWLFKYKEVLNEVTSKYDELENINFNDLIYNKLKEDSSILEVLYLITSNYLYFVNKTYELDESRDINDITNEFEKLKAYINNNEFIILNNIALLDEKQMKELIVNKCNLENINLTIESLLIDNIDKTCNDIKNLINYENIIKSGISIEDITL